jgi:hypothetical protein
MMHRSLFPLFVAAVLGAAAVSELGSSTAATAGNLQRRGPGLVEPAGAVRESPPNGSPSAT